MGNTASVFESTPAETKASVGYSSVCQLPDTYEASVFESKPRASTAHASSEKPVLPDMEGPSVCGSHPSESKASARADTHVSDMPEGPVVCESKPAISRASITAADAVPSLDGQHVFESQPESRKTDAAHGIDVAESGSEWETDSEAG